MENSKKNQAVQVSNSYWIKVVAIFFVGWILWGSLENNLV